MEVGDKVRIIGNEKTKCKHGWDDDMDEITDGTVRKIDGTDIRVDTETGTWWYYRDDLEIVSGKPSRVARILTEKVMVEGVKCRKITGFEGILKKGELPESYTSGDLYFYKNETDIPAHYMFDGVKHVWHCEDIRKVHKCVDYQVPSQSAEPIILLDCVPIYRLRVGDIYSEETYRAILTWLKRAGSWLAKIRKQEKEAWHGKQEDEI